MFHAFRCVFDCWKLCAAIGLDWVEPMMQLFLARHIFMHISCIRTLSFLSLYSIVIMFCLFFLSLSPSRIDCTWHPSRNLLRLGTLFVQGHLLLLIFPLFTFGSVMRRPSRTSLRTFLNVAFIRSHSHSGMGISLWDTFEVSHSVHTGVLLQYAQYRYLCTSVYYGTQWNLNILSTTKC